MQIHEKRLCQKLILDNKKVNQNWFLGLQNSLKTIFLLHHFWKRIIFRGLGNSGPSTCLQPTAAETFPATRLLPTTRHQHAAGWSVAAAHIAAENVNVFDSPGGPGGRCRPTSNKTCGWCHAKTKGQNSNESKWWLIWCPPVFDK